MDILLMTFAEWRKTSSGTMADYDAARKAEAERRKNDSVLVSRHALDLLFEFATSTDDEIEERENGLNDLEDVLPEIRRILGMPPHLQANEPAAEPEPEPELCSECGANLADDEGEGYDGLCGSCADEAEEKGQWS